MLRDKRFYFLFFLTILFRLPTFLFRGSPSGDETTYFGEILRLFEHGQSFAGLSPASVPKLAFLLVNAPFVRILYNLTGNSSLSVSVFPFFLSILSMPVVYRLTWRLYGKESAGWAGFLYAAIPFLAFRSSMLMTDTFFSAVFILATLFLNKYLDTRKTWQLAVAFFLMSLLCGVRPEGYIILFLAAVVTIRFSWTGWRQIFVTPLNPFFVILVSFIGVKFLLSAFIFSGLVQISDISTSSVMFGKMLGNMARRIQALYGISLPGGFTSSSKLEYIVSNWSVIVLAGVTWLYDIFKTAFVLTARTLPPLFFIFIGAAMVDERPRTRITLFTEVFLVAALISVFIYPAVYLLSHSRYIYLFPVVAIPFMARGLSLLENKTGEWLTRFNCPRISFFMLFTLLIIYVSTAFYLLKAGDIWRMKTRTIFSTGKLDSKSLDGRLVNFIIKRSHIAETIVMGDGEWTDLVTGVKVLPFPVKVKNVGGKWITLPVSYRNVVDNLPEQGETFLVFKRSQLYGMSDFSNESNYYEESLIRNLPYSDEGLELMRDKSEKDKQNLFSEFLPLWMGDTMSNELELYEVINSDGSSDTVKIFKRIH